MKQREFVRAADNLGAAEPQPKKKGVHENHEKTRNKNRHIFRAFGGSLLSPTYKITVTVDFCLRKRLKNNERFRRTSVLLPIWRGASQERGKYRQFFSCFFVIFVDKETHEKNKKWTGSNTGTWDRQPWENTDVSWPIAIHSPIADGFGDVDGPDFVDIGKIGDGARHLQYPVPGPRRESQPFRGHFQ
uniref:Uncharacterized protein n=1 Tax=Candidatus Kentrum sp. FW TaxID=2126338 RepID=A0A450U2N6_9GAMM|nr:MAG: hypothetical protein BECKFW1821C_GA0114237_11222 [Candidatus Kentron sp. FW]